MAAAMSMALFAGLCSLRESSAFAVVANTTAALGTFRRTIEENVFARLLVMTNDIRFAAGPFHLVE